MSKSQGGGSSYSLPALTATPPVSPDTTIKAGTTPTTPTTTPAASAPDPYKLALNNSQINRVNTYGADGSGIRYGYTDAGGNFVEGTPPAGTQAAQSYVEGGNAQAVRNALNPASLAVAQNIAGSAANLPDQARPQDFSALADQIFKTNYDRASQGFDRENNRLLTNLQARGLPIGGAAFNDAYESQQRSVNDNIAQMAMQAQLAAGQEQSRQFGLDSAARSNALSEVAAAMGGNFQQQSNTPSGQVPIVDYASQIMSQFNTDRQFGADQSNLDRQFANLDRQYDADRIDADRDYSLSERGLNTQDSAARAQRKSSTLGTIGSLAGAMIMKSDRRAKTDIVKIGKRGPLDLYAFRYIGESEMSIGYMAQEVAKIFPGAVRRIGAWLALDYAMLPEI